MSSSQSNPGVSVAIVGAGLSGLAAAVRLKSLGIPSIIYEAQNYAGGRVKTVEAANGLNLDLGATWFHGTIGNAALDFAVECGAMPSQPPPLEEHLQQNQNAFVDDYGLLVFSTEGIHVMPSGKICALDPKTSLPIVKQYAATMDTFESSRYASDENLSVLDLVKGATGFETMTPLQLAILRSRDLLECTINGCDGSTSSLSAHRIDDYEGLPGDNIRPGENGMSSVVTGLASKLEDWQIVLGAEVTSVKWGAACENPGVECVTLGFRDGTSAQARFVIWTPSLNVTKRCIETGVFDPALPKWKIDSLGGRQQGSVEKVFAVLENGVEGVVPDCAIPVVWELDSDDSEADVRNGEWEKSVHALTYDGLRETIGFWLSGAAAKAFTGMDEGERVTRVGCLLTDLLRQTVRVREVVSSGWGRNEFTRGSYSYGRVGCDKDWSRSVARPVPSEKLGVLCFAGEATHNRYYSTMHGAMESGYREADRCSRYLERFGDRSGGET